MMRKYILLLLITFIPVCLSAQDIIIKENGEIVSCEILREDENNVYLRTKIDNEWVSTYISKDKLKGFQYDFELDLSKLSNNNGTRLKHKEDTLDGSFKSFMFELGFNPFSDEGVFHFDFFQTKYSLNKRTALRLGIQLDHKKSSMTEDDYSSEVQNTPEVNEQTFLVGIKPGIEFRILPIYKISPYVGFELVYKKKSTSSEYTDYYRDQYNPNTDEYSYNDVTTSIDGGWRETISQSTSNNIFYSNTRYDAERAYQSIGANAVLGADFIFLKNAYVGFEIGLGYENIKYHQIEITQTPEEDEIDPVPSRRSNEFGFFYNNSIRLGIRF